LPELRPDCHETSVTGEPSSQGMMSNSWMAELVMADSVLVPGPAAAVRLVQWTISGAPWLRARVDSRSAA
jgi:hypothetical protein